MKTKVIVATVAILSFLTIGVSRAAEYSFPTGMTVSVERESVPIFKEQSNVAFKVSSYFSVVMPDAEESFALKNEAGELLPFIKEGSRYFIDAKIPVDQVIYWGPSADSVVNPVRVMIQNPIKLGHIHFDYTSTVLLPVAKQALRLMAQEMASSNLTSAYLVGMTDRSGSDDANLRLSAKRAEVAAAYLERKLEALGVRNPVIRSESMGEYLSSRADGTVNKYDRKVSVLAYPTV